MESYKSNQEKRFENMTNEQKEAYLEEHDFWNEVWRNS